MPVFLEEFLSWYLAPWRRMDRKNFGVALLVVSVPSLLALFVMAESAGGFIGPLMDTVMAVKGIGQGGDALGALENVQTAMNTASGGDVAQGGIAWMALLNNALLLAMFPLCRMRLRDMGYTGRQELGCAIAFNIAALDGVITAVTGASVVPLGWVWALLNFGGYFWLSVAKGKPGLAVHERMDYSKPETPQNRAPDPFGKDDDRTY